MTTATNKRNRIIKNLAFTLAEILIVLGIIGIIAEITIPVLAKSITYQVNANLLKQDYSNFSNAVRMLKYDNADDLAGGLGYSQANTISNLGKYLKYTKQCLTNSRTEGCAGYVAANAANLTLLDGEFYWWTTDFDAPGAVLPNGSVYVYAINDASCKDTTKINVGYCGRITIDVNGGKGPNIYGRDIFKFYLTQNGVFPMGSCGDSADTSGALGCRETGQVSIGNSCAARVILEGNENY